MTECVYTDTDEANSNYGQFIDEMCSFALSHFSIGDRVTVRDGENTFSGKVYYFGIGRIDVERDDHAYGSGENGSWAVYFSSIETGVQTIEKEVIVPCGNCPSCDEQFGPNRNRCECGECDTCCEHDTCNSCNHRIVNRGQPTSYYYSCHDSTCSICNKCENHCYCWVCDSCSEKYSEGNDNCSHCRYCSNCCQCVFCDDCGSLESECDCKNSEWSPGRPWTAKDPKTRKQFNCSRLAGIEWEYNDIGNFSALKTWSEKWRAGNHHDGSCGREVVTAPIAGDHIINCLSSLGKVFENNNVEIDNRCAVHVHVDASDYTWCDIYRLLEVYAKIEPLLYLLGGQQRLESTYSEPCGRKYIEALVEAIIGNKDKKVAVLRTSIDDCDDDYCRRKMRHPVKKERGRYKGLNIHPWLAARKYKRPDQTVEFRIHRDTKDANRVIGWVKLCVRLVDWCAKASDKEVKSLPKSALRALCNVIAPDCKEWILHRIQEWRSVTTFCDNTMNRSKRRIGIYRGEWMTVKDISRLKQMEKKEKENAEIYTLPPLPPINQEQTWNRDNTIFDEDTTNTMYF